MRRIAGGQLQEQRRLLHRITNPTMRFVCRRGLQPGNGRRAPIHAEICSGRAARIRIRTGQVRTIAPGVDHRLDRHTQAAVCVGPQFFQSRQQRRIASLDEKSNRLLSRGFYLTRQVRERLLQLSRRRRIQLRLRRDTIQRTPAQEPCEQPDSDHYLHAMTTLIHSVLPNSQAFL